MRSLVCLLALAAVAAAENYHYRFPGMQGFRWQDGLRNLPHVEECGLSPEEWARLDKEIREVFIDQVSTSYDHVEIHFRTDLPSDKVEAVMRGLYYGWRAGALERRRAELAREAEGQRKTAARIAELRRRAAAQAGDPDAVFDRALAVKESQARMGDLRTRLVDIRIEHAVAEARARAMRRLLERREADWKKRQRNRLQQVQGGTTVEEMIAALEYREDRDPLALDLTTKLTDLEVELVGHEERVKQIRLALEEEHARRVKLMTTTDLRTIHAEIEELATTTQATDRITQLIAKLENGAPIRLE